MKNINKTESVEVMALFGYEMTPCQPLSFKRRGENRETKVTELVHTQVKFAGRNTLHLFEVLAGQARYLLEFNSQSLVWTLTPSR